MAKSNFSNMSLDKHHKCAVYARCLSLAISYLLLSACTSVAPPPSTAQPKPAIAAKPELAKAPSYVAWHPDSKNFDASRYHLYYGDNAKTLHTIARTLKKNDLMIVDGRRMNASLRKQLLIKAKAVNARVIAYLSIGELDSRERERFDAFVSTRPAVEQVPFDEMALEWNDKFQSWRIDVSHPLWGKWIFQELQQIYQQDFHGVFLDTPDTADRYITYPQWTLTQRTSKVNAMIALIRGIKQQDPKQFVLLNRGLNLVGETVWMNEDGSDWVPGLALMIPNANNPDAVLYENAFASNDEWTQRMEADLSATALAKNTQVFALGYQDVLNDKALFQARCAQTQFICAWAQSSETLHKNGTEGP